MHIYNITFGGMPARPTGLAMSVMRRARALAKAGHTIEILISTFSSEFDEDTVTLGQEGTLEGGRIKLRSMYGDLAGVSSPRTLSHYQTPQGKPEDGWEYTQDEKRLDIWRGVHNGEYKHFVWMRGNKVNGIDMLVNGKRTARIWYDSVGLPCKVERMDADNKPYLVEYLNPAGKTYLQETRTPAGAITNIALHTPDGIRNFPAQAALVSHWLLEFVFKDVTEPMIISEYGFNREALGTVELRQGGTVIYTFHSSHRAAPYTRGAPVRPEQRDFFKHIRAYKAVVFLTDEQQRDIQEEFGPLDNLHVIPHHMPAAVPVKRDVDPNRIVMIGRFHEMKGHADVIRALEKVLAKHPAATLHLFGRGEEESKLRELTASLGLQDAVHFRGFTANAFAEFAEAAVSVVASDYEGFCLSLAESMSVGCVPVSYRFQYGPADLLTHGEDGLLVERGDIDGLATAIISLLTDPEKRNQMAVAARKITGRLTEERLVKQWTRLLSSVR